MHEFGRYIHALMESGKDEAQRDGSAAVEAQHLLLAMTAGADDPTRRILTSAGLDHQALRDALDQEFEHSLAAAGVSLTPFALPAPSRAAERPNRLGASTRQALVRAMDAASRKKNLDPAHLLLGILEAQAGTVPRALALAGVNQAELTERVRDVLHPRPAEPSP
jgi:ATP-dependent Clp protease ATP-binding subunit ClpA